MENKYYKNQVALLLKVLPEVAKESCFALHGGTAINLFIRNMPRLSVDIDLTYLIIEDRDASLNNISQALERIKTNIETVIQSARVVHQQNISKLLITISKAQIKLEVNQTNRGIIAPIKKLVLCEKAQEDFDAFCSIQVVSMGQLFGGKICAALDRQHPRDLFDVKYLLENEGFTEEIKQGVIFCILCSNRPINELLSPHLLDHRLTFENQFEGMSTDDFSYSDYETIRENLLKNIHKAITETDKKFLLSFMNTVPDWTIYDYQHFPAIQWKLKNLAILKKDNSGKHLSLYKALEKLLSHI